MRSGEGKTRQILRAHGGINTTQTKPRSHLQVGVVRVATGWREVGGSRNSSDSARTITQDSSGIVCADGAGTVVDAWDTVACFRFRRRGGDADADADADAVGVFSASPNVAHITESANSPATYPLKSRMTHSDNGRSASACTATSDHGGADSERVKRDRFPSDLTASPGEPSVHGARPRATPASRQSDTVVLAPLGVRLPAGIGR